jgi:hypothetical protein
MACNCVKEVEQKSLNQLKERHPNNTYDEKLNGFDGTGLRCVAINLGSGSSVGYNEFKAHYTFQKTNGETSIVKTGVLDVYHIFCPFCGKKHHEE